MIYLLQVAEKEKKPSESKDYSGVFATSSNVESLTEKRKEISQAKAREKVLNASTKINW
ncbi:hypothetical protein [Lonsdalea quercina]|uniref:hypothetical protein n=1 Tax=Lonsdalea quercina TaxID=71657 RepID=UPI003F471FBD